MIYKNRKFLLSSLAVIMIFSFLSSPVAALTWLADNGTDSITWTGKIELHAKLFKHGTAGAMDYEWGGRIKGFNVDDFGSIAGNDGKFSEELLLKSVRKIFADPSYASQIMWVDPGQLTNYQTHNNRNETVPENTVVVRKTGSPYNYIAYRDDEKAFTVNGDKLPKDTLLVFHFEEVAEPSEPEEEEKIEEPTIIPETGPRSGGGFIAKGNPGSGTWTGLESVYEEPGFLKVLVVDIQSYNILKTSHHWLANNDSNINNIDLTPYLTGYYGEELYKGYLNGFYYDHYVTKESPNLNDELKKIFEEEHADVIILALR